MKTPTIAIGPTKIRKKSTPNGRHIYLYHVNVNTSPPPPEQNLQKVFFFFFFNEKPLQTKHRAARTL